MFEDYKKLRPFISEFTFGIKLQYKDFDKKEVVGVLVSSSSLIRKGSTMKRVSKLIRDMELDLKVDEYNDRLPFFRIIKKIITLKKGFSKVLFSRCLVVCFFSHLNCVFVG